MKKSSAVADELQSARHKFAELRSVAEAADQRVHQTKLDICLVRKSSEIARVREVEILESKLRGEKQIATETSKAVQRQWDVVAELESRASYEKKRELLADLKPSSTRLIEIQDQLVEVAHEVISKIHAARETVPFGELFPGCDESEAGLRHEVMQVALRLQSYKKRLSGSVQKEAA
jgi:hypothetical protein